MSEDCMYRYMYLYLVGDGWEGTSGWLGWLGGQRVGYGSVIALRQSMGQSLLPLSTEVLDNYYYIIHGCCSQLLMSPWMRIMLINKGKLLYSSNDNAQRKGPCLYPAPWKSSDPTLGTQGTTVAKALFNLRFIDYSHCLHHYSRCFAFNDKGACLYCS